jgi:hypothetical protein
MRRVSAYEGAVVSTLAAACATAPGSSAAGASRGTKRAGRWPHRGRCPRERLADELWLPAGQLDEPLDRHTAFRRVPEREVDKVHRAADRLDRDVLTGLRPAQLLHRSEHLTMAIDGGGELALGLRPGSFGALPWLDARRHRRTPVARSDAVTSEPKLPPSLIQRSASSVGVSASPEISRRVVRGSSSGAQWMPQRQQAFSWLAIGAWQWRHTRGRCRSRMSKRPFVTREPVGSLVGTVCMSAAFSSTDSSIGGTALPSLGTKLSVEIAVRREAGRCSARSRFAGAVK